MKYKAVIFDLDGTLLDTLGDILLAVNSMLDRLGYNKVTYQALKSMIGDGAKKMIERATGETCKIKIETALNLYNEIYEHTTGATQPFMGIVELLTFLWDNNIKTAVLSNKPHRDAVAIVNRVLGDKFDIVVGESPLYPPKPDIKGLEHIVSTIGVNVSECLYVGDAQTDFLTPTRIGMPVVSALWGYRTREQLEAVGARDFIDTPICVIEIIK